MGSEYRKELSCPNRELFERYAREVQIEKRLINKVCEDRELSDLILNLHKYKKQYRDLHHQSIMKKEAAIDYTSRSLYPKHSRIFPDSADLSAEFKAIEKECAKLREEKAVLQK